MRIISQEGLIPVNLPYEQIFITVTANGIHSYTEIIAAGVSQGNVNSCWVMAKYPNMEKANKAMSLLIAATVINNSFNVMDGDERALIVTATPKFQQKNIYGIFQFPTEKELDDIEGSIYEI